MHADRFDDLARRFARAGLRSASRRAILREAAGAATLATAVLAGDAAYRTRAQEAPPQTSRPPGRPDVDKLLFDLEYDVEKIFRYVADNVRYEPYAGVLRGPLGVLWGMSGNSYDQALLLKALLEESLVKTRLVIGTLDSAAASKLLDASRLDAAAVQAERQRVATLSPDQLAATPAPVDETSEDAARRAEFVERAAGMRPALVEAARVQLSTTVELLASTLEEAGVAVESPSLSTPELELSRHVWVQAAQGTTWIDLDPSMPEAELGVAYATGATLLETIPEADFHTVTFRVVADVVRGGSLVEEELLTQPVRSADVTGVPISFLHSKPAWIGGTISNTISGQEEYRPYIQVGATVFEGLSLFFGGQGGVLDALGEEAGREGEPIAERLEIVVTSPGAVPLRETRTIFDRMTEADRASEDLATVIASLPPVEMVDLGEDAGLAFLPFVGAANLSVVSAPVPLVYFVQDFAVPDVAADLASQGHSYHFLRDMLSAEFAEELGVRFIRNRPCVTMLDIGVAINEQGEQVFQYQLDLVQPTLLAAPLDGARAVYPAQLVEGVLSQVAERNLLEVGASTFPEIIGATFTNIGVIFEAAAAQEIGIRTLSPEKGLPDDLAGAISPAAKVRIEEHLAQGLVVVVPERPVELDNGSLTGWWAIDPTTGRTVDRLETGRGSELGEHATLLDVVVHVIHETYVLGMCVAGIAAVVVSAVFVISDYQADAALGGAVAGGTVAFAFCAAAVA